MADERHYLPSTVPALKRIAAAAGDRVCENIGIVTINERVVAWAKSSDPGGRRLFAWYGCKCVFQPKRTPIPANVNGEGPRLWCNARVLVVVTIMPDGSERGVAVRGRSITLPDW